MHGVYGKNLTADGFNTFALKGTKVVNDCLANGKSMRECARQHFYSAQQVIKGMYAAFAPDWLSVYPGGQIRWIMMEEYKLEPAKHIQVSAYHNLISHMTVHPHVPSLLPITLIITVSRTLACDYG